METDPSISLEILIILVLIIANGIFAMAEIAVVSSRKARLERLATEGGKGAKTALELANEPTQLLSTVQVGITAIGVVTGAYGGVTIARAIAEYIKPLPYLGAYANSLSMVAVVASITYASLIVGELVPKRIALNNPEPIAIFLAVPMRFFSKVFSPLVKLLSISTDFAIGAIGIKKSVEPAVTEEEIRILIAEGTASGTFEETEREIVDRVFRLGDMRASALMTPRTQIDWIDLEDSEERIWEIVTKSVHFKLPVARGSLDDIVGVVYIRDLLADRSQGALKIAEKIQEPLFVPRSLRAFKLLEQFQQTGVNIALVIDEFGGMVGLVTLQDILEELVGDFPQEADVSPGIVKREDNSWLVDGLLPIQDFKELFAIEEMPEEDRDHYHTVGGFITSYLGTMPGTGETFEWGGFKFEIVDMDRMRIDKVIVARTGEGGWAALPAAAAMRNADKKEFAEQEKNNLRKK